MRARTQHRGNSHDVQVQYRATKRAFIDAGSVAKKAAGKVFQKFWHDLKSQGEGITGKTVKYMQKKPGKTLLGVGIAGVILGMFLRRK